MEGDAGWELCDDNGTEYRLKLSSKPSAKNGGYEGVVKQGNLFHCKLTLERGAGQTMLDGHGCNTAQQAALKIAKFRARGAQNQRFRRGFAAWTR